MSFFKNALAKLKRSSSSASSSSDKRARSETASQLGSVTASTSSLSLATESTSGTSLDSSASEHQLSDRPGIYERPYYHGLLCPVDAEGLLKKPGDFLLRVKDTLEFGKVLLICVRSDGGLMKEIPVQMKTDTDQIFVDARRMFSSVEDLVDFYKACGDSISSEESLKLISPVDRPAWLLQQDKIRMEQKIGQGAYGEVYLGLLLIDAERYRRVAIKTLHQAFLITPKDKADFLKEARILRLYDHENLLASLGVCVERDPILLVMEYAEGGPLLKHLQDKSGLLGLAQLVNFLVEISQGMRCLEKHGVVHRDLAARNCMLKEGTIKVGDFGLSMETPDGRMVESDPHIKFAIKWLAPEVLNGYMFSTKSDVWAFGVVMYEVFTYGSEPYPDKSPTQVAHRLKAGESGVLVSPPLMPKAVVAAFDDCLNVTPDQRPTFLKLKLKFRKLLLKAKKGKLTY